MTIKEVYERLEKQNKRPYWELAIVDSIDLEKGMIQNKKFKKFDEDDEHTYWVRGDGAIAQVKHVKVQAGIGDSRGAMKDIYHVNQLCYKAMVGRADL